MRFLGFRFLWGHKPKKADVFLLLLSRRRTKEGFPCGGRKGVARSERSILSPSTELERRRATSGRATAGHKVTGLWPDAAGYLSLRPFRQQVGPVPTDGRGGIADAPVRRNRTGAFFASFFGSRVQRKRDVGICPTKEPAGRPPAMAGSAVGLPTGENKRPGRRFRPGRDVDT